MNDLLDNVYLPDLEKRSLRESDTYKLLQDNNIDTSEIEGYENHPEAKPLEFEDKNSIKDKEEWMIKHHAKDYFSTIADFILETGKDVVLSGGVAAINGADVATNLFPIFAKAVDKTIIPGKPDGVMSDQAEKNIYKGATLVSENLGKAREYLKNFKKDDNFISQLFGIMGQDAMYSLPIYNKLKSIGVPKYPAFAISGAIGGAVGIEDKIFGDNVSSTFAQEFWSKDIIELKNLIGILPNTPEDKIADEVVQALEYGAFSAAIPGIIDGFKFMKRYIPAMAGTTAATVGLTAGNEAEGNPLKAITTAISKVPIFKSAVIDAANKVTVRGSGEQIYNTIKNTPGVKENELKWLDLESFLKDKKSVTQQEVLDFVEANKIDVSEVKFGGDVKSAKLSDDLEFQKNEFEDKWLKANTTKGSSLTPGARRLADLINLNYDVYKYGESSSSSLTNKIQQKVLDFVEANKKILTNKIQHNKQIDFSQLMDSVDQYRQGGLEQFLKDDWLIDGNVTIVKLFDNKAGTTVRTTINSAKKLLQQERYSINKVIEIPELEFEKLIIENTRRNFTKKNVKAPKFEHYTEPGGKDYTELVFSIKKGGMDIGIPIEAKQSRPGFDKAGKVMMEESLPSKAVVPFKSASHMNVKSEIAHVRFKTRDLNGKKVLSVEEMQSDFAIAARKSNENQAISTSKKVTDFPFKNTWYELTTKRLIRYAADNGFDAIAIPKGSVPANRYGETFGKAVSVQVQPRLGPASTDPRFIVKYFGGGNRVVKAKTFYPEELNRLEKEIGSKNYLQLKDNIDNFIKNTPEGDLTNTTYFSEFDKPIIIGSGKGKHHLYDKAIPSFMKKYSKKWNAKVYDDVIESERVISERVTLPGSNKIPVTILEVTPEMKQSVQGTSQPLFELFGGISLSTWGAKIVSDNIENNIISNKTN